MRKNALVGCAMLTVSLTGCTAFNTNYYIDGRPLGKGHLQEFVGLGVGQSYDLDVDTLAVDTYEIETSHGGLVPVASVHGHAGLTSNVDFGIDIHSAWGITGGRGFVKYSLADSAAKFGFALLPAFTFGQQWGSDDDDDPDDYEDNLKIGYVVSEIAAVMSYHPSPRTAVTFGPRYYFQKIGVESKKRGDKLHHKGGSWHFSPGISAGIHIPRLRFETTLVYFDRSTWVPYFGLSLIVEDRQPQAQSEAVAE